MDKIDGLEVAIVMVVVEGGAKNGRMREKLEVLRMQLGSAE
jgi:hypothetical protein